MKRLLSVLLFLAVWSWSTAVNAGEVQLMTATQLNLNGRNLADAPLSNLISMDTSRGFFNQLTLVCAVTWGTSAQLEARCKGSYDDVVYGWVDHCTGVNPKSCKPLEWRFPKVDNTDGLITLELRSNYKYYKCQLDDAADGTGTVVCTAGKGRQ